VSEPYVEWVYVARDGSFVREWEARDRAGGLPPSLREPVARCETYEQRIYEPYRIAAEHRLTDAEIALRIEQDPPWEAR
jgi:hypothetical protein